ncbi:MAG TPA: phage major capsid protein [Planctomycetota bacterium]|nr:phage major capsid protein [Planctomycetota bacterium]
MGKLEFAFTSDEDLKAKITGIKDNDTLLSFLKSLGDSLLTAKQMFDLIESTEAERVERAAEVDRMREELRTLKSTFSSQFPTAGPGTEEKMYNFGRILRACMTGDRRTLVELGGLVYPKAIDVMGGPKDKDTWPMENLAKELMAKQKGWLEKADLGTPLYSDAVTGSYLVPVQYIMEVLQVALQASQLMGKVQRWPMTGITAYYPKINARPSFTWRSAQTSAKTESNPTFTQGSLTAYTAATYIPWVDELDEDSLVPLGVFFRDLIGQAWGQEFDTCVLKRSTDAGDLFDGVLYAGTAVYTMPAGQTTFASATFDDLRSTVKELTTMAARAGATWAWHPTVWDHIRSLKDAMGQYHLPVYGNQEPPTVLGYPRMECDAAPALSDSAVSTPFIALFNPKNVVHGDRIGLAINIYPDTAYKVEYGENFIAARVRAAFKTTFPAYCAVVKTAAA